MRWCLRVVSLVLIATSLAVAFGTATAANADTPRSPITVVLWISIDGMRGDYVDRADTPFLHRLMKEGAYTQKLTPVFPSLTFPSHVSQVAGAAVSEHGIIGNAIYDRQNDRRWSYPNVASEILSEPIWTTVKRGGCRVAVQDWPVSQQQVGRLKADYFDQAFETSLTDQQRMERLLKTWSDDAGDKPLQLLMGYVSAVDKAGHKFGPDAPETTRAVEETDVLLAETFARVEEVFKQKMAPTDTLYFLLTTDHGMDDVHSILNLEKLFGDAYTPEMRTIVSGSVGNVFLERLAAPADRPPHAERLIKSLEPYKFAHAYAREDLPKEWAYNCPTRTGDVVVSLDPGYMFSEREGPAEQKIDPAKGPLGMHGYPPAINPKMLGLMTVWRSGPAIGGKDLGPIDTRRMHATIANWLGVAAADYALAEPIKLP